MKFNKRFPLFLFLGCLQQVVYLCSEQCDLTHEIFSVGAGRFARIFVGVNQGWNDTSDSISSADDVAANHPGQEPVPHGRSVKGP